MEENITAALASFAVEDGTLTKPNGETQLMIRLRLSVFRFPGTPADRTELPPILVPPQAAADLARMIGEHLKRMPMGQTDLRAPEGPVQ
jgi:hypothetical protein